MTDKKKKIEYVYSNLRSKGVLVVTFRDLYYFHNMLKKGKEQFSKRILEKKFPNPKCYTCENLVLFTWLNFGVFLNSSIPAIILDMAAISTLSSVEFQLSHSCFIVIYIPNRECHILGQIKFEEVTA